MCGSGPVSNDYCPICEHAKPVVTFVYCPLCHERMCNSCISNHTQAHNTTAKEFMTITLCGSTKFKEEYEEAMKELTLAGYLVISVGCFGHKDDDPRIEENKEMLDQMHKEKINMSDVIYVINVDGYIGNSTMSEILHAQNTGKQVFYLEEPEKEEVVNPYGNDIDEDERKGLM